MNTTQVVDSRAAAAVQDIARGHYLLNRQRKTQSQEG
jgi:hypothetical protein